MEEGQEATPAGSIRCVAELDDNPWVSSVSYDAGERTIHFTHAGSELLRRFVAEREAAFLEQFGYEMGPCDPLLWDPAEAEPTPLREERFVALLDEQVLAATGVVQDRAGLLGSEVVRTFLTAMTGTPAMGGA